MKREYIVIRKKKIRTREVETEERKGENKK